MNELMWGNALLFVCVIIEIILTRLVLKETLPWKEIIINLNSGLILMWILRGVEVVVYIYILGNWNLELLTQLPLWAQWVVAFIVWDFCFYWLHRLHHAFKLLWSVHVVHHEGEHYSLSLGIRNSWYSSLTSIPFFVLMAVAGTPIEIMITVSSIHYFIQFYNHNHLVKNSGILEKFMVTPSHHRVHHGKNDPYIDKNFSGTFVIWDKLFGTFQSEMPENPVQFGVDEPIESYNPVLINNIPFLNMLGIKWRPKKSAREPIKAPNFILATGSFLLFVIFLYFVYFENLLQGESKLFLFSLVFVGTIGLGMLSDGKRLGLALWTIASAAMPICYVLEYPIPLQSFEITLLVTSAYSLISLFWIIMSPKQSLKSQTV